jgi:hypothetical protein
MRMETVQKHDYEMKEGDRVLMTVGKATHTGLGVSFVLFQDYGVNGRLNEYKMYDVVKNTKIEVGCTVRSSGNSYATYVVKAIDAQRAWVSYDGHHYTTEMSMLTRID